MPMLPRINFIERADTAGYWYLYRWGRLGLSLERSPPRGWKRRRIVHVRWAQTGGHCIKIVFTLRLAFCVWWRWSERYRITKGKP